MNEWMNGPITITTGSVYYDFLLWLLDPWVLCECCWWFPTRSLRVSCHCFPSFPLLALAFVANARQADLYDRTYVGYIRYTLYIVHGTWYMVHYIHSLHWPFFLLLIAEKERRKRTSVCWLVLDVFPLHPSFPCNDPEKLQGTFTGAELNQSACSRHWVSQWLVTSD